VTDGNVDRVDLTFFASRWLDINCVGPGWCEGTDLNQNKKVDFTDFAILANHWLEGAK
jgi:hypothetical protein